MFERFASLRARTLVLAALVAFVAAPLPALAHNVMIENPLANRMWVTVYANGSIHWSGMINAGGHLRYETRQAAPTFQAEVKDLNDHRQNPRTICKTRTSFSSDDKRRRLVIRLNSSNTSCWWDGYSS
ncbi:MAG: hypothetical protein ACRENA_06185 [Vulcanimicrobiaceae bacterium]